MQSISLVFVHHTVRQWTPYNHYKMPEPFQRRVFMLMTIYWIGGYDEKVWTPSHGLLHDLPIELIFEIISFMVDETHPVVSPLDVLVASNLWNEPDE